MRHLKRLDDRKDDRGQVTSELLMWIAIGAGLIALVIVPRMTDILNDLMDAIAEALPG